MDAVRRMAPNRWDRLLTYGLATWLARLDGVTHATEIESLRALEGGEVTQFKLKSAASAAFDVAMQPEGRRPEKYDFGAFETILRQRLPTVK